MRKFLSIGRYRRWMTSRFTVERPQAGPDNDAKPTSISIAAICRDRQDVAFANDVVASSSAGSVEIELDSTGQVASPEEVVWRYDGSRQTHRYALALDLFAHPFAPVMIERLLDTIPALSTMARRGLPSGITSIGLGDTGLGRGLAFCDAREDALLIPDPVFLARNAYQEFKSHPGFDLQTHDRRQRVAFWRGSSSGWHATDGTDIVTWRDLPRVKLCRMAADPASEGLLDAKLTALTQISPQAARDIAAIAPSLMADRVPWTACERYRYQLDIDGNSNSWEGLFLKLCSASVVLKVRSAFGFRQWYYDRLVPWRNVVPIEPDMSDLVEKIKWLRKNPDVASEAAQGAWRLAASLGYDSEIERARPTVARALRAGV